MSQPEASPKSILFLFFLIFRLVLENKKPVKPGPAELKTIWSESKEIAGIFSSVVLNHFLGQVQMFST